MKKYWDKALPFEEYIKTAHHRLAHPETEQDENFKNYYELGIQRTERTLKRYKRSEEELQALQSKNFDGKILIISETWCGDASSTIPVLTKFFEDQNEVKIFLRDSDKSLINQFLTNGTESIPKVLILDKNFEVKATWGPRTKYGSELLAKYKKDPEAYPKDEFYNDLQVYYAKNKGKDVIQEILELL